MIEQPKDIDHVDAFSSDADTYDKWLQALNGVVGVLEQCGNVNGGMPIAYSVVPLLVVPNLSLWQVDYDAAGAVMAPARQVAFSTVLVNHVWSFHAHHAPREFLVSHVEILTPLGLAQRLRQIESSAELLEFATKLRTQA